MIVTSQANRSAVVVRTPVRISFGGGGTDLAAYYRKHGGFVVSTTINRYCYAMARPAMDGGIHINSADFRMWQSFRRGSIPEVTEPLILPKVVLEWFAQQGLLPNGVELFLASEVAAGTGLGSSSSMCVALILALATYSGLDVDTNELADLACQMEIERLQMPIGKQDQYASTFGGLNTIEFRRDCVRVRALPLAPRVREELQMRLLLFSTNRTHNSADILRQQRANTETKPLVVQHLHQLKELAAAMCERLQRRELDEFGALLHESWQAKKQLSHNISTSAIDEWYEIARKAGALGGKISGAGGGGFLLLYCPLNRQRAVREHLSSAGLREMPFTFDTGGAQVIAAPRHKQPLALSGNGHRATKKEPNSMREQIETYWKQLANISQQMPIQALSEAADHLSECYQRQGTVFVVGNGGSAATASHFACDLAKGTRTTGNPTFRVIALSDNVPLITAWANDVSYEYIFAEQLAALLRPNDVLVAISTSGNSPNVVAAAEVAHKVGATTIALTGPGENRLQQLADLLVQVPSGSIEQVEDAHLAVAHSLCVALRGRLQQSAETTSRSRLLTNAVM